MNPACWRLEKPSGPAGAWEAWRAKDSKDAPGPRCQPWEGQEAAGAATSGQRERVRGYASVLGCRWPGIWPPSPCGRCHHHCPPGGPALWPHQDPQGQTAVPTSPFTTPCRACSGIPLLGPCRKEPHARHHRGCRGADRLPMCQNPHSPSVDTELQASRKQMEGHERVAPCVPNHGEHTVSLRKRSGSSQEPGRFPQTPAFQPGPATEPKDRGLSCGREQGGESRVHPAIQRLSRHPRTGELPTVSAVPSLGSEGRATSVPAVPFTPAHVPCPSSFLHLCAPSTLGHQALGPIPHLWSPTHPAHTWPPGPTSEKP